MDKSIDTFTANMDTLIWPEYGCKRIDMLLFFSLKSQICEPLLNGPANGSNAFAFLLLFALLFCFIFIGGLLASFSAKYTLYFRLFSIQTFGY